MIVVSDLIHISIDDILSGWKSSCTYKNTDGDVYIDECSVGRICNWGGHYIAIIHDDVPEDEREALAEFIANAPSKIKELQEELEAKDKIIESAKEPTISYQTIKKTVELFESEYVGRNFKEKQWALFLSKAL